jgi:hypothetical protein
MRGPAGRAAARRWGASYNCSEWDPPPQSLRRDRLYATYGTYVAGLFYRFRCRAGVLLAPSSSPITFLGK